jgi:hypothetical protein
MTPHFAKNGVRTCNYQRDGMTVTGSRLDKLGISIGADLICGRSPHLMDGLGTKP